MGYNITVDDFYFARLSNTLGVFFFIIWVQFLTLLLTNLDAQLLMQWYKYWYYCTSIDACQQCWPIMSAGKRHVALSYKKKTRGP
jgi:hypothetical protein